MGGDYDWGFRNSFRAYGSGAGDRRLEIVSGKVYSASQSYNIAQPGRGPPSSQYPRSPPSDSGFPPSSSHRASSSYYYAASSSASSAISSSAAGGWFSSDAESKRRRRLKSYKVYSYEGKVKSSFRQGFRWIKGKCSDIVHGW